MVLFFPPQAIFDFDTDTGIYCSPITLLLFFFVVKAYRLRENHFETVATVA